MPILLTYAYNPEPTDQKIYGIVRNDNKVAWLASTLETNNFEEWQLIKSFKYPLNDDSIDSIVTTLIIQIKDNLIYIVDLLHKNLFIIPIKNLDDNTDMIPYKLPDDVNFTIYPSLAESFFIQPTVNGANLYICSGNKLFISKDKQRNDWAIFHQFQEDSDFKIIKANQDIMALYTQTNPNIYLAPMGSNNFQNFYLYPQDANTAIDEIFLHNPLNGQAKILTLIDLLGYIGTFKYQIDKNGTITITKGDVAQYHNYGEGGFGIIASSTQLGYKVNIGIISYPSDEGADFYSAVINMNGVISLKAPAVIEFSSTDNNLSETKLSMDTHGPIIYLDSSGLYVSLDQGANWQQQKLTFKPATNT